MEGKRSVSRDAAILSAGKVLNMGITLVTGMLLARFRTLSEYGTYSQIQTVVNLATAIFMLGLPNSLNYFVGRAKDTQERSHFLSIYYNTITVMTMLVGVILFVALPLFANYYSNQQIKDFDYIFLVLPWTQIVINGISNMLVASGNTIRVLVYNILHGISTLALIIVIKMLGYSFSQYMVGYIVVESAFAIWVYIEAGRLIEKWTFRPDIALLKSVIAFAIPMGIASAIGTLSIQLDRLMVGYFFTTEELAVFSNAGRELPLNLIPQAFTSVLVPVMARMFRDGRNSEAIDIWKKAVEFNAIIMFFCAAVCVAFAPQLITLLYSEKYLSGTAVFRVYGLVLAIRITYYGIVLNAKGKTKFIMYSSVISLAINCICNYILMRIFGMIGAAIATLMSLVIMGVGQVIFSAHVVNVPVREIFPWGNLLKILIINIVWSAFAMLILERFSIGVNLQGIVKAILIGILCAAVYLIAIRKRFLELYRSMGKV